LYLEPSVYKCYSIYRQSSHIKDIMNNQTTIKVLKEDHAVLKELKRIKGQPIQRLISDMLRKEYKGMYK